MKRYFVRKVVLIQWQQSIDNVIWLDISSATSAQLSFSGPLFQTTYYRRVTSNTMSNAFGYSTMWRR